MDKITDEEAQLAFEQWRDDFITTDPQVHKLLECVGENKITYDGYKIWTRTWEINTYKEKKQEMYNTKQLIEQFLKEVI
jgi:hypothetical protein